MPGTYPFELYREYHRDEVAKVLEPSYVFTRGSGSWGLWGIVNFGGALDFVFFVTFGQSAGKHHFDEGIDENGVLRWQSQPAQRLTTPRIRQLIQHDETRNDILLFLRTSEDRPYAYLGRLKYLAHDVEREEPVHFQWKLLDFDPVPEKLAQIGLRLEAVAEPPMLEEVETTPAAVRLVPQPWELLTSKSRGVALTTAEFQARHVDYETRDRRMRNLGQKGEELVVEHERQSLEQAGRPDLAAQVEHVAATLGDGAGYDVRSFHPVTGAEVHIEVKTTTGPPTTPFYMSASERAYAAACPVDYRLYRIFRFDARATELQFTTLDREALTGRFEFTPTTFRVRCLGTGATP